MNYENFKDFDRDAENLCIYHGVDMDGWCSAELVNEYCAAKGWGGVHFVGMNYQITDPWMYELYQAMPVLRRVFIVDYHIEPKEVFALLKKGIEVFWYDHHTTAIDKYAPYMHDLHQYDTFHCLTSTAISAAALTLQSLVALSSKDLYESLLVHYPNVFDVVRLVSTWDTWNKSDPETFERAKCLNSGLFERVHPPFGVFHKMIVDKTLMERVIEDGRIIIRAKDAENARICESNAGILVWHDMKFLVMNGYGNSSLFDAYEYPDVDAALVWHFSGKTGMYKVSMYSLPCSPVNIDVASVATLYGGGGHKGAAGFSISELPFSLKDIRPVAQDMH